MKINIPRGHKVLGKVITITDYGIFIELEEGIEGLIHVSEIDWLEKSIKPSKYFSIGDRVEAVILKVNKDDKRISLSIRQLKPNPWNLVKEKICRRAKDHWQGKKILLNLEHSFPWMKASTRCSMFQICPWAKRVKHPSDILTKGQDVEVEILNIEPEKERISVGLKQLTPDPWMKEIPERYSLGDSVTGKVISIADFGLFIEIEGRSRRPCAHLGN